MWPAKHRTGPLTGAGSNGILCRCEWPPVLNALLGRVGELHNITRVGRVEDLWPLSKVITEDAGRLVDFIGKHRWAASSVVQLYQTCILTYIVIEKNCITFNPYKESPVVSYGNVPEHIQCPEWDCIPRYINLVIAIHNLLVVQVTLSNGLILR